MLLMSRNSMNALNIGRIERVRAVMSFRRFVNLAAEDGFGSGTARN